MNLEKERPPQIELAKTPETASQGLELILGENEGVGSFFVTFYNPGSGGGDRPKEEWEKDRIHELPVGQLKQMRRFEQTGFAQRAVELDPRVKMEDGSYRFLVMLDIEHEHLMDSPDAEENIRTKNLISETIRESGLKGWLLESKPGSYSFFMGRNLKEKAEALKILGTIAEAFLPDELKEVDAIMKMIEQLKEGQIIREETAKAVLQAIPRKSQRKGDEPACLIDLRGVAAQSLYREGEARGLMGMRITPSGSKGYEEAPKIVAEI